MDESGKWRLSPSYDLTFSTGPGGEHCTSVMQEGRKPGVSSLLKLAKIATIKNAIQIIDQVKETVAKWPQFAKEAHVTPRSLQNIQAHLTKTL